MKIMIKFLVNVLMFPIRLLHVIVRPFAEAGYVINIQKGEAAMKRDDIKECKRYYNKAQLYKPFM